MQSGRPDRSRAPRDQNRQHGKEHAPCRVPPAYKECCHRRDGGQHQPEFHLRSNLLSAAVKAAAESAFIIRLLGRAGANGLRIDTPTSPLRVGKANCGKVCASTPIPALQVGKANCRRSAFLFPFHRCGLAKPTAGGQLFYSHSTVAVGFGERSKQTRLTPGTSFRMRSVIFFNTAQSSSGTHAVITSTVLIARRMTG